jgi:hypothetical protein
MAQAVKQSMPAVSLRLQEQFAYTNKLATRLYPSIGIRVDRT